MPSGEPKIHVQIILLMYSERVRRLLGNSRIIDSYLAIFDH